MYKDKDKQREANRLASKKRRQLAKREREGMTTTLENIIPVILSERGMTCTPHGSRQRKRGKDIKCFADLPQDVQQTLDMMSLVDGKTDQTIKANRTAIAVNYQAMFAGAYYPHGAVCTDVVVTGKPGGADYDGICTPEWRVE